MFGVLGCFFILIAVVVVVLCGYIDGVRRSFFLKKINLAHGGWLGRADGGFSSCCILIPVFVSWLGRQEFYVVRTGYLLL